MSTAKSMFNLCVQKSSIVTINFSWKNITQMEPDTFKQLCT